MGNFVYRDLGGSSQNKGECRWGEGRETKRRGPKPKKKRAKQGAREERDEAVTVSPSSPLMVKISSVQCGGVTDGHGNSNGGVLRQDSAAAVGGDNHARGVRGGSVGARRDGRGGGRARTSMMGRPGRR